MWLTWILQGGAGLVLGGLACVPIIWCFDRWLGWLHRRNTQPRL